MATFATKTRPSVQVTEIGSIDSSAGGSDRVDRAAGIIRRVKILGLQSLNKAKVLGLSRADFGDAVERPYRYSQQAAAEAATLYEGMAIFTDHPEFKYSETGARLQVGGERKTHDRFGKIVNVVAESDGLYGDLHVLTSHGLAATVFEAAEKMPDAFALSHNARAVPELINGEVVITRIYDVRSVDLVSERPGTTNGLFETAAPDAATDKGKTMKKTIRQIVESAPKKAKGLRVLEMMLGEEMPEGAESKPEEEVKAVAETDLEVPAEASAEEQLALAFNAAVSAILSEKIDVAEKKARIGKLLDLQEAATEGSSGSGEGDAKAAAESKAREEANGKTGEPDKAAVILESVAMLSKAGVPVSETYLEAMAGLPSKDRRQSFVSTIKANTAPVIEARSSEGKQVTETAVGATPKTDSVDLSKDPDRASKLLRGVA